MTNEMNLMNMDERQRLAWFMANRGTLIAVGAAWIAMIGWHLSHGQVPTFLLIMVPVFALLRGALYFFYASRPFVETGSRRGLGAVQYGKAVASALLLLAAFLPLYRTAGLAGVGTRTIHTWSLINEDVIVLIPLLIAYLWPVGLYGLKLLSSRRVWRGLVQYLEPFFVVVSAIIVLTIPQLIFENTALFGVAVMPTNPMPAWGCYLAVAANALYLASWFAGLLRPCGVQEL